MRCPRETVERCEPEIFSDKTAKGRLSSVRWYAARVTSLSLTHLPKAPRDFGLFSASLSLFLYALERSFFTARGNLTGIRRIYRGIPNHRRPSFRPTMMMMMMICSRVLRNYECHFDWAPTLEFFGGSFREEFRFSLMREPTTTLC